MSHALLLNLGQHDSIAAEERDLLMRAFTRERVFSVDQDIVSINSRPTHTSVILDGMAARYKVLADGRRQITAVHIPGDFVDLHGFILKKMDHGVVALSPCRVAMAEHDALRRITESSPHLTRLLWLETLIDGAIHREWLVAMGRRKKTAHLAHFICELFVRLQIVQRTDGNSFHLPLSQVELADVLGISVVHFNRVLQHLRRQKLVAWSSHTVTILNLTRLMEVAEFDPTYLSLQFESR
jgi:CRP-like cAMP-binding protein